MVSTPNSRRGILRSHKMRKRGWKKVVKSEEVTREKRGKKLREKWGIIERRGLCNRNKNDCENLVMAVSSRITNF